MPRSASPNATKSSQLLTWQGDSSNYNSRSADAKAAVRYGYQMQMAVDLTVEMLPLKKTSIHNDGLEASLMIESD